MKTIRTFLVLILWTGVLTLKTNADITNGLVAWWTLDETIPGTAFDSANVLYLNGTPHGNGTGPLVDQLGRIGTAYYFDGASDYISFVGSATAGLVSATNDFSEFQWFYMPNLISTVTAQGILFSCNNGQTGRCNDGIQNEGGSNLVYWFQNGGISPPAYFGAPIVSNQWYLMGVTRSHGVFTGWLNTNAYYLGSNVSAISTSVDWVLGRQINGSSFFHGLVDDLRVYDRALVTNDVVEMYDQPSGFLSLQSLNVQVTRSNLDVGASQQARGIANFTTASGTTVADATLFSTFQSDNTNVVSVTSGGLMQALSPGTANISVSFSNQTAGAQITVKPLGLQLIHRYSFTTDASDSVGTNNGSFNGSAFVSNGQLQLSAATQDFVDFGPNAIAGCDEVSFEAWVSFGANAGFCRLFDFGNNDGIDGSSYVYLSPHTSSLTTQLSIDSGSASTSATAAGVLDGATNEYVAAVFNPLAGYMSLYLNGALAAQVTNVTAQDLAQVVNAYSYLGKSQFAANPYINMSVDEFRVYRGVLQPTNLAVDAAAGPDVVVSSAGALQSVSLTVPSPLPEWATGSAVLLGNFANVSGVNLDGYPAGLSFVSGDTNVAMVGSNGAVTAVAPGTTTITASYSGMTAFQTLVVSPVPTVRVLIAINGSNAVASYDSKGTNWRSAGYFAVGSYGGSPLTGPEAMAQDSNGVVYVAELATGGRILKFTTAGSFLGMMAKEGVNFSGDPNFLAYGPDGNLYFSTALGTDTANTIDELALPSGIVTTNIPTTDLAGDYTLSSPRGIAFGPDGYLYVCNRGPGGTSSGRNIVKFDMTNGTYVSDFIDNLNAPNQIIWDGTNNRFLFSANDLSQILASDTNGVTSTVFNDGGSRSLIGLLDMGTNVYFTDYQNGIIAEVLSTNSSHTMFSITQPSVMMVLNAPTNVVLNVQETGGQSVLTWMGGGSLQSATNLAGAFSDVFEAVSPYTIPAGTPQIFYRVRVR